ncbi:MAG TPA: glycosyltransferase family 2 protein [Acidimicrobiia bacterium]|nr:glycosyltransferase family 2 protein [Acidimicrobiia bacterium]
MVRALAISGQVLLLALVGYNLLVAAAGWRRPRSTMITGSRRRMLVVIPAHDEESVVGRVVADVAASRYPEEAMQVWVIADRCSDRTASVAREAGARVAERTSGEGGKGAALAWFLDSGLAGPHEAVAVFDADNRVPPDLLARFDDRLEGTTDAVQAYLDVTDPGTSWVAQASALSYWASNRMVQLARHNLEWPVDLGGTGMCLTREALDSVGGFADSLVEDQDLSVRLALAGLRVGWLHEVRVRDEKPSRAAVAIRQRARWARGRRRTARSHFGPLLRAAIRRRSWGLADLAIRLVQPSRTLVAAVSAALALLAALVSSDLLLPWGVWLAAALGQFIAPIPFLARDGVPGRWIVRYPLLALLAILWIPVQVVSRLTSGWHRTPHRGDDAS